MAKNSYKKSVEEVLSLMDKIKSEWVEVDKNILNAAKSARKLAETDFSSSSPKDLNERLKKNAGYREQVNAQLKEQERLEKALISAIAKKDAVTESTNRALQKTRIETNILNKQQREQAELSSKLVGEYRKQSIILNQLRTKYKNVALTQGESSKAARKLKKEVNELDAKLKRVDANVGQFQRSVGNYGKAFKSLGGVLRSTAAAFGIMGAGFMAASIIKGAIRRVREFDKEMQNMAGITRSSRKDLKDLEKEIINVAATSIKTSNEVAKLATSLLTLGKTKDEVKLLLKPVNDLGIGLNTTSEEAGEFLVQTLNSFGKGAESAEEFADIIATIRTSTSLDFQKMRDSFQYLSPISRALGKDLAYTGAVIGILADNGLKAEQAGRLLGTAQQRLASKGRTLVDALNQINQAQKEGKSRLDVLALASDLFGKQAGKVGVILANNTDIIEKNAQAIRDNKGALKDLTDQQMEALDAKIKILDSTWEKFILNIENGRGAISNFVIWAIEGLTNLIDFLDMANKTEEEIRKNAADRALAENIKLDRLEVEKLAKAYLEKGIAVDEVSAKTMAARDLIAQYNEASKSEWSYGDPYEEQKLALERYIEELTKVEKKTKENSETIDDGKKILEGSVAAYEKIKKELEDQQSRLATTTEEWKDYQSQIDGVTKKIEHLKNGLSALDLSTLTPQGKDKDLGEEYLKRQVANYEEASAIKAAIIEKETEKLDTLYKEQLDNAIKSGASQKEIDAIKSQQEQKLQVITEALELEKQVHDEFAQATKDLVIGTIEAVADARVESVNDEIEANRVKYAEILASEKLSEEQRSLIEAERDKKEVELEKKKRQREKEAFLIKQGLALAEIAINLAKTISAINLAAAAIDAISFGIGGTAYKAANIPFAIGTAAAQTGLVLAQSIPKFKDGHLEGTHEGKALVNDAPGGNYKEVVENPDGSLLFPQKRNTLIDMKRGTKVHKDYDSFLKKQSYDKLVNASIMASIADQHQKLSRADLRNEFDAQLQHQITSGIKEGFKNVKIQNNTNNDALASKIAKEMQLNRRANV